MGKTSIKGIIFVLIFIFVAPPANAQDDKKTQVSAESALPTAKAQAPTPVPQLPIQDEDQCRVWHASQESWAVILSPRYMHLDQGNADAALVANGFSAMSRDTVGMSVKALWQWKSGLQFGVEFGNLNTEQDLGNYETTYTNNYFGPYFGYDLGGFGDTSFYVGTGIGYSGTQLEIFSAVQNGRENGTGAYINPTLGFDQLISRWLKLGLSFSYFYSFLQGSSFVGQNLNVNNLSPMGFAGQLNISLGRFK